MAVTNYNKKCSCCGGNKWEYDRELKLWRCRYCDAQVERQEQYDGLYTIKNVVRQVILDCAYRRMEQADRNLSECQKINARYAGTLVAGICCRLIMAVEGTGGQEPKALLGQLRRDYQLLTEESRDMSDDETAVYEFLDSSDAWAVLATVFDTLGDEQRRDYLLTLMNPGEVFSKQTNKSLLRFALKNGRLELAEKVLANRDNVDISDALRTVLQSCPDSEQKGRLITGLLEQGALSHGQEEVLDNYLSRGDSAQTKTAVALAACRTGLTLHIEVLLREVLGAVDLAQLQELLQALFTRRLFDGEIEALMGFAAAQTEEAKCLAVLDAMVNSGQFVALNLNQTQAFVCNTGVTPMERLNILQRLKAFSPSERMWESAAGAYLCQVREPEENREMMLAGLCKDIRSLPARDFENYVLGCTLDGGAKPDRIRMILGLPDMNLGFFRELAGKYLRGGRDDARVKPAVLHQLLECGLSMDGSVLMEYICSGNDTPDGKAELLQLAQRWGTRLPADAVSSYLERCCGSFSPVMFAALYHDGCKVTNKALENYVLRCNDDPSRKAGNAYALAARTGTPLGSSGCEIRHQGNRLSCNLAQAYILTTSDHPATASYMVQVMAQGGTRLNPDVQVDGRSMKFSKYLASCRGALSQAAEQICQENRLFSRFF